MAATILDLPNPVHPSFIDRLDGDFLEYYNKNIAIKPATHTVDLAEVRQNPKKFAWPWCKDYSDLPFVNDIKITSGDGFQFTIRTYHPDSGRFGPGPFPIHINLHGGGFCFGDLTSEAEWCLLVRNEVGIIVVDVDYRLTPVRQAYAHAPDINGLSDSISIGGVSAGGFYSCIVQQLARDANLPLKLVRAPAWA
ncbi:triacylglycerol lipase [Penicillium waksmanii]|uniref:triacylglycerol lipase n=1 Tax=Penicillium waksmanii TaxID=69791 RepID=UPI002549B852|nr:triacylglycerol lipase [Penicillium waksmanii]KAJ5976434.1 triacylglycerol lipase [Penicillium waksmanii]